MSLNDYFRDELSFLRLQGREFTDTHPQLTRFLSEHSADPDVERLLEGFAFLTGSLRAKIEDEFPELTHGMLNMLWPNYLRPVPSMTIMEFSSKDNTLTEATLVPKGVQIGSIPQPISHEEVSNNEKAKTISCSFSSCRDVWVFPMSLEDSQLNNSNDLGAVTLSFSLVGERSISLLNLNKLSLYLGEDEYTAKQLYLWLSHYFSHAELHINGRSFRQSNLKLKAKGFDPEDALLPYPKNAYSGYRILQEYCCFPESFLFFDLSGFDNIPTDLKAESFKLTFYFKQPLPANIKVRPNTFRLNCTPAINLFKHHGEPVNFDGQQTDYPLLASHQQPEHYEIFSINRVEGWLNNEALPHNQSSKTRLYQPFGSFQHQIEQEAGRPVLYYRIKITESIDGQGYDHRIAFVRSDASACLQTNEVISTEITCTNRLLPMQLQVGEICIAEYNCPSFINIRNITRPSMPLRPIMDERLHWTLISNLSLNYLSLLNREALLEILRCYDFPALHDKQAARAAQKRLNGLQQIETKPVDRLFKGIPIRGLHSSIKMQQSAFLSEGDLYLFSSVLARFFSLYASVNSFHQLEVVNVDNLERYTWPIQIGQHSLI